MSIELGVFLSTLVSNPAMLVVAVLNIGVLIVNGATDAPNAIATVVSTRCLKPTPAIVMAACCNFLGLLIVTLLSSAVAETIFHMVDCSCDSHQALVALMAAMVAIIVWGVSAWYFGLPTSQSHSLIAGLTGAAIALQGGFGGVNWDEWMKVIYGIVLSTFLGFGLGWLNAKAIRRFCSGFDRQRADVFFRWAQVIAGAAGAFMHGAQDGQKFMSIFMLASLLAAGADLPSTITIPIWLMVVCALSLGTGTGLGGKKIIKNVGMDMVKLERYQGFCVSLASTFCLIISTFGGLPVSSTHTNTTAIMGVGRAKCKSAVHWGVAVDMVKTWILTFPGCCILGYVTALLFLAIF